MRETPTHGPAVVGLHVERVAHLVGEGVEVEGLVVALAV
jgi:hypothetical protein